MAYVIQALIAKTGCFGKPLPKHLRIVLLQGGIEMIPLGNDALEFYGMESCPFMQDNYDGIYGVPPALLRICETLSQNGTVAYIEAEFFGGDGSQAQTIFEQGKQIIPPVVSVDAINQALRFLGVSKGSAYDEFDAVGLGQHRFTDEWLGIFD